MEKQRKGRAAPAGKPRGKRRNPAGPVVLGVLVVLLGVLVFGNSRAVPPAGSPGAGTVPSAPAQETPGPDQETPGTETPGEEQPQETETPLSEFSPYAVDGTQPANLIQYTNIQANGSQVDSYQAADPIDFGYGRDYTDVEGIVTFRGNNFRDSASYGTANITEKRFGDTWTVSTGSLSAPDGAYWSGSGWVGQPLMMTWPKEVRAHMNMYDWAKEQDALTEVIYATMDGYIYFIDLATGQQTRDKMYLGYTFKGAGALDPRGYPIMYLGSGYDSYEGKSRAFIINLLDCTVMYTFGNGDSFSLRGNLSFFDGSALVDAETDQLIYPGESGVLYLIKLNTQYDPQAGTLSISPDAPVKWRYYGNRSGGWYLGMEDSAVIWRGHIIFSTNDGYLFCLDLNTLQTVWVQDVLDDTNCTPVLELEDGHPYVYISTSFHLGWRSSSSAEIPVWKIDAVTGEIVWKTSYTCYSVSGVSGGVQGTLALGKNALSDLIFVPVARTPNSYDGVLVALDKQTGEEVWSFYTAAYSWSSPVAVYDAQGNGYLVYCTSGGQMYLLDGLTGEVLDTKELGGNVEASPAVYNDTVVVGTRTQQIFGVKLK